MDVTIRTQRPGDRADVRAVITEAFGRAVVADLAEALRAAPCGAAGLFYVAEVDGRVAGHVQLTRSWVDAPARLLEVLVLSPLAVAPAVQGRGVGGRLVRHALGEAERVGAPLVFLEGSPRYYPRFGFEPAGGRGFTPPSVRIPDAAFQVVVLPGYEPWMTGALVYAEQFWTFDCVGRRDPGLIGATVGGSELATSAIRSRVARVAAANLDARGLLTAVGRQLARSVPAEVTGWLVYDPETVLPVAVVADAAVSAQTWALLCANEKLDDDVGKFRDLARRAVPVTTLRRETRGAPATSACWRDLMHPTGLRDELRAALVHDGLCWAA